MITDEIRETLLAHQDIPYRDFQMKLIPECSPDAFIGVRTPQLRALARQLLPREDIGQFLESLPHALFDENQLHAFLISGIRDFRACLDAVDRFLPYVDNWATCDQLTPGVFKKHHLELLDPIRRWIGDRHTYTIRFGIRMLMNHFLDEDFLPAYPDMVAAISSEEYYVRMMIAWYFATALAKQYDSILPYFTHPVLDIWTHNRAIQKALESYRIDDTRKAFLKTLKVSPSR